MPPIIVSSRELSEGRRLRSISSVSDKEFRYAIGSSLADYVGELSFADLRQRGVCGVQSDLGIRGATFEQSAVLINGVRINDPQTGHHNMDIPLTTMDVSTLELLRGGGSALYGPDAFGGALNIVTKQPDAKGVEARFSMGSNDYLMEGVSITQPFGLFKSRFSFERRQSSGYRKATDFEITTCSFDALMETDFARIEALGGYAYKDFGAATFYSTLYPNQGEYTDTRLGILHAVFKGDSVTVEPRGYLRRHRDRFVLDRDRRFWVRNTHTTYTYGTDIQMTVRTETGIVLLGAELSRDAVDSTNLNKHTRDRQALFGRYTYEFPAALAIETDVRADRFSDFGWEVSPSINMGYGFGEWLHLRSSVGRAYRIPSFTDLYYVSPANIGNTALRPESAWSYEAGFDFRKEGFDLSLTCFYRRADDVIDWVRDSAADPWRAVNQGRIDTTGVETLCEFYPAKVVEGHFIERISTGYDYLRSEQRENSSVFSKYALDYRRHHAFIKIITSLYYDISAILQLSYKERNTSHHYFLLDAKLSRQAQIAGFNTELYIEGSNLLNTSYSEVGGVPMPGITVVGGARTVF